MELELSQLEYRYEALGISFKRAVNECASTCQHRNAGRSIQIG
jgi:hypothetical protein